MVNIIFKRGGEWREKSEAHLQVGFPWVVLTRPLHSKSRCHFCIYYLAKDRENLINIFRDVRQPFGPSYRWLGV
jgi:hypothetical protein